jgi:hypothetical protein
MNKSLNKINELVNFEIKIPQPKDLENTIGKALKSYEKQIEWG